MCEIGALLILYGIPASGKSFFAHKIEKSLIKNFKKIFFFDVDDLEYYLRETGYDENLLDSLKFFLLNLMKIQNEISFNDILSLINKNYLAIISNEKYYASAYDKNIWIYSRALAFELIEFLLKQKILTVCEDTFLLQSMRKKLKSLCKRLGCGFCDIFIECTLEKALKNNEKRKGNRKVGYEIIEKAFANIEISKKSLVYSDFLETEFSSFEVLLTKLKTPILKKKDNFKSIEEKEAERKRQEEDILLNLDLDFRKIISILNGSRAFESISENKAEEKREKEDKLEIFSNTIRLDDDSIEKLERIRKQCFESGEKCDQKSDKDRKN